MLNKTLISLLAVFVSVSAFADNGLLNNVSLPSGCNTGNLGASSGVVQMIPNFEISTYVCNPGYYLPADGVECEICPNNNYCVGGAFAYNTAVSQGIHECPNFWLSPEGMHELGSCGRILHIGNETVYVKSTKQTTPSLNVQIGNDTFYANMTEARTLMNKDSERYLRVQWGNNDYYVCDDTTCQ